MNNISKKKKNSSGTFYKVIVLGDSSVGKTTLINRYVDEFYKDCFTTTIGVDFKIKRLIHDGQKINLQIWDTAGQQKFKTLTKAYFQGCMGIILAFSLTSKTSYESINHWINQLNQIVSPNLPKVLAATKSDNFPQREVSVEDCSKLALSEQLECIQVSSKTGYNVQQLFHMLTQKINKRQINQVGASRFQNTNNESNKQEDTYPYNRKIQSLKLGELIHIKSDCKC